MVRSLCVCPLAPQLALRTRVAVIMHVAEAARSSNTGRLVPLALANSFIGYRGMREGPTNTKGMIPEGYLGMVLYPSADSAELNKDLIGRVPSPLCLVVLDGSWSQSARMARREPALAGLPRVRLPPGPPSSFRLRAQTDPSRVCTFEAVARALGAIEGPEVRESLEAFFTVMVERMLWARGKLKASEVAGGLPAGAIGETGAGANSRP